MNIQSLTISNFRCFRNYHLDFTPGITILIGRNGAGKSTLIDALKIALSFVFATNKELGNDFLAAGNPSLSVNSFDEHDFHMDAETRTVAPDAGISAKASYNGVNLEWQLYKRSTANAALYSSKYKVAFSLFSEQWSQHKADLPLLAYISDSFPHKNVKETKFALDTILKPIMPRNFGYYQWDFSSACTSIWEQRLCNKLGVYVQFKVKQMSLMATLNESDGSLSTEQRESDAKYQEAKETLQLLNARNATMEEEVLFVTSRLKKFSASLPQLHDERYTISDFSPVTANGGYALNIVFDNTKECLLRNLPAGYCRLYSIVLDLAYREYILNGNKESSGVVMIDEIDLHLHPSLEHEVVGCLRKTFPEVQFILSTHSPLVVANIETYQTDNQILSMVEGNEQPITWPDVYGIDYNSSIEEVMGVRASSQQLDEMISLCAYMQSKGLTEQSDAMKQHIHEKVKISPELLQQRIERKLEEIG